MRETAELLASLGHEVVEADAAAAGQGHAADRSPACFGPAVALRVAYGELLAGRAPEDDEIEPLSRALCELSPRHDLGRVPRRASRSCRRWRAA